MLVGLKVERDLGEVEFFLQDDESIGADVSFDAELVQPFALLAHRGEAILALHLKRRLLAFEDCAISQRLELIAQIIGSGAVFAVQRRERDGGQIDARSVELRAEAIVAIELEQPDKRPERQPLNHERRQHDGEGGEHNKVALRE